MVQCKKLKKNDAVAKQNNRLVCLRHSQCHPKILVPCQFWSSQRHLKTLVPCQSRSSQRLPLHQLNPHSLLLANSKWSMADCNESLKLHHKLLKCPPCLNQVLVC
jgi:hypothetical protein